MNRGVGPILLIPQVVVVLPHLILLLVTVVHLALVRREEAGEVLEEAEVPAVGNFIGPCFENKGQYGSKL